MSKRKRKGTYSHQNKPHVNPIRVRGTRRKDIDETKLALAYWLIARRIAEDRTDAASPTESEVEKLAKDLDDGDAAGASNV